MALPNLDYKIMQGNSLLESCEGVDLSDLANVSTLQIYEPQRNLFGIIEDSNVQVTYTQRDGYEDL